MQTLSHDDLPPLLNAKVLDPFQNIGLSSLSLAHEQFEHLKHNCKYVVPTAPGTFSDVYSDDHLILHINNRSILTNDKFEEFQTFLYSTDRKHWSVIC